MELTSLPPDAESPAEVRLCQLMTEWQSLRGHVSDEELSLRWTEISQEFPEADSLRGCLERLNSFLDPLIARTGREPVVPQPVTPSNSAAESPERRLGDYQVFNEIGRGGMGIVYRARHLALGSEVAIKVVRGAEWLSAEERFRFQQEARAAAGFRHPHIVTVHAVGEQDGLPYLVMDLVTGGSLSLRYRKKTADPLKKSEIAEAVECVATLAEAVQFLHDRGIIHRDLKPANVLLDEAGQPQLTDFGLAKVTGSGSETLSGALLGTPEYMSPEQAQGGSQRITPRTDVYGLGAVLYYVLTASPPFRRDNPLDTLLDVLENEPVPPRTLSREIPRELEMICLCCLEKSPDRRYPTAQAVADDLRRCLRHEPLALPRMPWWNRWRRWARREPGLVARLGGLLITAFLIEEYRWSTDVRAESQIRALLLMGIWGVACVVLQKCLNYWSELSIAPFAWAFVDMLMVTALLFVAKAPVESLFVVYPLLIAASGLWLRVRHVLMTTGVCLVSYSIVHHFRASENVPDQYTSLVVALLLVIGAIVAYQVYRLRILTDLTRRKKS